MAQRMTFQELRDFMWETAKGQVVDSLIAVEIGLLDYETFWEAHLDFYDSLKETHKEDDLILDFLVAIAEFLDMTEAATDIDKVLGARAHD